MTIGAPGVLEPIFHTTECKSEKRAKAVAEAFAALKDEFKDLKRQLKKIVKESGADMASLLTLTSEEPLTLMASSVEVQQFFTIQGVCKGYHLPGEAEHPWEWGSHWMPILTEGAAIGPDFVRGLQIASSLRGDPQRGPQLCLQRVQQEQRAQGRGPRRAASPPP